MKRQLVIAAVALYCVGISGCAKRPDAIIPIDVPSSTYSNLSCPQLSKELAAEHGRLAIVSRAQNNAANGDAFGVFLIGVPASSLTGGDKAGDVAIAKGRVVAIENSQKARGCH